MDDPYYLQRFVIAQNRDGIHERALKLHSSMTLFLRTTPDEPRFQHVLDQYFDGRPDTATDQLITE